MRRLLEHEVQAASSLVVEAFQEDIVAMWGRERTPRGKIVFEAEIESILAPMCRNQTILISDDLSALAAWADPPNVSSINRTAADEAIIRRAARAQYGWRWIWQYREPEQLQFLPPREPHMYLAYLAVSPSHRGQGLGSKILGVWLEEVDARKEAAFLDNSSPANLPFYERHGFRVIEKFHARRGAPPTWRMWRAAQKA